LRVRARHAILGACSSGSQRERARSLVAASEEARGLGHSEINSTDLLLALTRDDKTAPLLASLGVDEPAVREAIGRGAASDEPPAASAS
jgi:hypothetical protein